MEAEAEAELTTLETMKDQMENAFAVARENRLEVNQQTTFIGRWFALFSEFRNTGQGWSYPGQSHYADNVGNKTIVALGDAIEKLAGEILHNQFDLERSAQSEHENAVTLKIEIDKMETENAGNQTPARAEAD